MSFPVHGNVKFAPNFWNCVPRWSLNLHILAGIFSVISPCPPLPPPAVTRILPPLPPRGRDISDWLKVTHAWVKLLRRLSFRTSIMLCVWCQSLETVKLRFLLHLSWIDFLETDVFYSMIKYICKVFFLFFLQNIQFGFSFVDIFPQKNF